MKWKITTLIENHADKGGKLVCEHGLSVLIEGEHIRLLMDTGQSGAFYENADRMNISLSNLDAVLLSHAHYDHTGGLLRLIKEEGVPKKLYVGKHFFRKCYDRKPDGRMKYIGTKFDSRMLKDLGVPVEEISQDQYEIAPGLTVYANFARTTPYEVHNPCFFYQEEDNSCGPYGRCMDSMNYKEDTFEDEIALALDVAEGLFVIVGCSHPGIVNILTSISQRSGKEIYGVIGGTHLMDADRERVLRTVDDFKRLGVKTLGVSHCTGDEYATILQENFGETFFQNHTGNVLELE